jgi:hypothetical protein
VKNCKQVDFQQNCIDFFFQLSTAIIAEAGREDTDTGDAERDDDEASEPRNPRRRSRHTGRGQSLVSRPVETRSS